MYIYLKNIIEHVVGLNNRWWTKAPETVDLRDVVILAAALVQNTR